MQSLGSLWVEFPTSEVGKRRLPVSGLWTRNACHQKDIDWLSTYLIILLAIINKELWRRACGSGRFQNWRRSDCHPLLSSGSSSDKVARDSCISASSGFNRRCASLVPWIEGLAVTSLGGLHMFARLRGSYWQNGQCQAEALKSQYI